MQVRVTDVQQLGPSIREIVLKSLDGRPLPSFTAGSHVEVALPLAGEVAHRHYSLCSSPSDTTRYRIAVLLEPMGRGGSHYIHQSLSVGDVIEISLPRNNFPLRRDVAHSILIAGGIGITPILSMCHELSDQGSSFEIHYAVRNTANAVFLDELKLWEDRLHLYGSDQGERLDIRAVLFAAAPNAHVYVCGPNRLIDALRQTAVAANWHNTRIHSETFGAERRLDDHDVTVELKLSGLTIVVPGGTTILEAMLEAGVFTSYDCKRGECGSCSVSVIEGTPDHRDSCLTPDQRRNLICTCVSRSTSSHLVLEL